MSVIDEIKQKLDIVEVIGEYSSLTKAGRTFKGLCPLHSEKHPSFYVYPQQQSWHCFGACSTGGDVFSFLMKKQNISFSETLQLLAQKTGVTIPQKARPEAEQKEKGRLYQANEAAAQYFYDQLLDSEVAEKARDYLTSRGLKTKTVSGFKLGYSPGGWEKLKQYLLERGYTVDELLKAGLLVEAESGQTHDRFRNKVMFPICNAAGRVSGFGARVLDDSQPKYINSPQTQVFDKSGSMYGIDLAQAAIREQDLAVIVEGYMDVLSAYQNGFNNVVAAMGTSVTERQVTTLKRLTRNIVLALDADAAGEEAMLRCVGFESTLGTEIRVSQMPQGKDPDDVIKESPEMWQKLVAKALPAVDYTFNMVISSLDLGKAKDKSQAADKLLPVIAEIKDMVRQGHYLQKLARILKVSEHNLEMAFSRFKSDKRKLKAPKPTWASSIPTSKPLFSHPIEEYCLTLMLKHPELKGKTVELRPEYFEGSENREIFLALKEAGDLLSLKERLDSAIWEHVDFLMAKDLPSEQVGARWEGWVLRLHKEYLRNLMALQAEGADTKAEFEKQVIEVGGELREIFVQERQHK